MSARSQAHHKMAGPVPGGAWSQRDTERVSLRRSHHLVQAELPDCTAYGAMHTLYDGPAAKHRELCVVR